MKKNTNNITKKVLAVVGAVAIATIGVGAGFILDTPQTITKLVPVTKIVPGETVTETVYENVTVEVPVEVFVEVDNGNLDLVLDEIYQADGSVEYLIEDLDDDELAEVVDRIVLVQDAKTLAMAELEKEAFDELDMEVFNSTITFDEDELYRLNFDDEDFSVVDVDFDREEVELTLPFTFKMDGVKYSADAIFSVEENEVEDLDIENIQLV